MFLRRLPSLFFVKVVLCLALLAVPTTTRANPIAAQADLVEKIVFVAGTTFATDTLDMIDPDGSNNVALISATGTTKFNPVLSPDGKSIAYLESKDKFGLQQKFDIYVWEIGSTTPRLLTKTPATNNRGPGWSPDGKQIVFVSIRDKAEGGSGLYAINADGTEEHKLPIGDEVTFREYAPTVFDGVAPSSWSPDGKQILFSPFGYFGLYVVAADGSGAKPFAAKLITEDKKSFAALSGAWSPDGKQVLLQVQPTDTDPTGQNINPLSGNGVAVANADGTDLRLLVTGALSPAWSPDGKKIVFTSASSQGLQVMNADGSDINRFGGKKALIGFTASWGKVPADLVPKGTPAPTPKPTKVAKPTHTPKPTAVATQ